MTEFIPGAGPPPHKIPILTLPSSQQPGDPDKRIGSVEDAEDLAAVEARVPS
jgi:hypothetical protein